MQQAINRNSKSQINVVLNSGSPSSATRDDWLLDSKEREKHAPLKKIQKELATLVGMEELKELINEIYAWLYINKCRESANLKTNKQVLHMMFKGNPGTGKTTVARMIGKLFHEMNVLSKGHLIEAERADLVGEYIGHTAQKTRDLVKKALGGVLFVDEAYSLARGGEKDFGKEAIDTLVKAMEDQQNDFILILAGYSKEMENFLTLNPGLPSRFPVVVSFPDYTVDQLMDIARRMIKDREYKLSYDAERKLKTHLQQVRSREGSTFSNGRYIRNLLEKSMRKQSMRLLKEGKEDRDCLLLITERDLHLAETP
ncbi:stage V sporulation protein K [Pseudalkalibacillus salsuginis]|uniref:stage V sporulation protein K n=1 Tax=Pseudalkalibacillus salsuginis TaxID=2910972 RepID=UPI001CD70B5A|nr:stage V sporulation protein K [Pseudalkalibacillus salsuginis]MCF6410667.1 stage V sporulation protein K [Pseudalkalibacillus salsuginis]